MKGTVKWFNDAKGYGFITSDDGQDVFLHATALPDGTPALKAGARLEFGVADTPFYDVQHEGADTDRERGND